MDVYMTDLELSEAFGTVISGYYSDAVDFLQIKPDFSLWRFREVIEELCIKLADRHQIDLSNMNLSNKINELHAHQVINYPDKENLHTIRLHCNSAVHKSTPTPTESDADYLKEASASAIEGAERIRSKVISVLQSFYVSLSLGNSFPPCKPVSQDEFGGQRYKEILYHAATTDCAKNKFKAGLLLDSLADRALTEVPIVASEKDVAHIDSLRKSAVANYEASCLASADAEKRMRDVRNYHMNAKEIVETYCDLEALYRYALASLKIHSYTPLGGSQDPEKRAEHHNEPFRILSIAADRGHPLAAAYYGEHLYDTVKDYSLAKQYLIAASVADAAIGFRWLSIYYSEGLACKIDREKALQNINKGIELGCYDSMAALGEAYHKGTYVDKDEEKAEELLKTAIDGGSIMARNYYRIEFNDLAGHLESQFQIMGKLLQSLAIQQSTNKKVPPNRISRNDLCFCGSGIKYKKCCY